MKDLREIESTLVRQFEEAARPEAAELHDLLEKHRGFVTRMWGKDYVAKDYAGLAKLYHITPDFISRYEALAASFLDWLPKAMLAHATRLR